MTAALADLVRAELTEPVDARVSQMAAAIAAEHPAAARAVLFYGSCLRERQLDGLMLDFYLIVSSYRKAYGKSWLAIANRLVPPNVFPFTYNGLAAKYAVLSEKDFLRLSGAETLSVSIWARFAQPSRLVWSADAAAADAAVAAAARAAPTLLSAAAPMMKTHECDPLDLWRQAFALTYSAELRAERQHRSASVVETDPDRYRRFTGPALAAAGIGEVTSDGRVRLTALAENGHSKAERMWAKRRRAGKMLSVARLAKATGTYSGGIDYLAWKINRHAGTRIEIKPWHRRWPLLAAFTLLPRLLKGGAIR